MLNVFSDDIAIDLGTVNTLVHVKGRGVVVDEPSVVAVRSRAGVREVLAVGSRALEILGRTPENVETIWPMRDGVIADFVATEEMLRRFIKTTKSRFGFRRPRILICVPAGATPVERRAVYETAVSAGSRKVYLIEEPVAAALGCELPIDGPAGSMVVDIGGGTTDVAVLSLGGVLQARSLRCAGNAMDEAIIRFIRREYGLLIGESNAERIKIEAGSALINDHDRHVEIHIRGRGMKNRRPKSLVLGPSDIAQALEGPVSDMADFFQRVLDDLPGEVFLDIRDKGIALTGGGACLSGLDVALERLVDVKFHIPQEPTRCVVRGSAQVLDELDYREHLLIRG